MYAPERHHQIVDTLDRVGRVSVAGLASDFGVTTETIRRDLDTLEQLGRLRRVHGGAVGADQTTLAEASLDERLGRNATQKDAIARAALALIPPTFRGSVLLDAGSTTGRLAELLTTWTPDAPGASLDLSTNSVPLAGRIHNAGNPHLHAAAPRRLGPRHHRGGRRPGHDRPAQRHPTRHRLRRRERGDRRLRPEHPDEAEAAAKSAMVRAARRVVVLADSTKLDAESLVRFANLDEVDTLITDAAPSDELADALAEADVQLVLA